MVAERVHCVPVQFLGDSEAFDGELYVHAVHAVVVIEPDWLGYRHQTDIGLGTTCAGARGRVDGSCPTLEEDRVARLR